MVCDLERWQMGCVVAVWTHQLQDKKQARRSSLYQERRRRIFCCFVFELLRECSIFKESTSSRCTIELNSIVAMLVDAAIRKSPKHRRGWKRGVSRGWQELIAGEKKASSPARKKHRLRPGFPSYTLIATQLPPDRSERNDNAQLKCSLHAA